jgi:hypothetical protein
MIYFFSYGDDNYKQSKNRIYQEALRMGFDDIKVYGPENLPRDFVEKTTPHILQPRGAGYWIWKSYFLKQTFDKMQIGDICIYADAGCHLNPFGKERLSEYFEMINKDESGVLSLELVGFLEKMYTNEMVFEYFGISEDDEFRNTSQLVGGILFFRKCENSIKIIDEYHKIACERPDLFSDVYNNYKRKSEFRDHRHDQSILGIIRKKNKSVIIPDESYALNFKDIAHVPVIAARIRQ